MNFNMNTHSEGKGGAYLEGYILLHDALQVIHLLAHGRQGLLHLIDLHLAALPVALLGLLVLQLLAGCAIGATQGACMHGETAMRPWLSLSNQLFLQLMPGCASSATQPASLHVLARMKWFG